MTVADEVELHLANRTVRLSSTERDEWARRAIKVFQGMEYSMTAYARVLTGDPAVRLQMASGSAHTDGRTIYYRPPLALGDPSPHVGGQCDRRDPAGHLICPACSVREFALRQITHEVAHIVGGSFATAGRLEQQRAVRMAVETVENPAARSFLREGMGRAPWGQDITFVMGAMSPYLKMILMMLEDARIDLKMFRSRPGTRKMFQSVSKRALERGFVALDGSRSSWSERPLNAQIMIGLLCKAESFDYSGLHEKIIHDLDDPVIADLTTQVSRTGSATDIAAIAVQTLVRLWEMGYCDPPEEMPPPPESEPEQQEEEQSDESSMEQSDDDGEGSPDEPDGDGEQAGDDPGRSGSDDSSSDQPTPGEEQSDDGAGDPQDEDLSESAADESDGEQASQGDPTAGEESDDSSESSDADSVDGDLVEEGPPREEPSGDLGSEQSDTEQLDAEQPSEPSGMDGEDSGGNGRDPRADADVLGDSEGEDDPSDEESDSPGGDDEDNSSDESPSDLGSDGVGDNQGYTVDEPSDGGDEGEGSSGSPASEQLPEDLPEQGPDSEGSSGGSGDPSGTSEAGGEPDAQGDQPGQSGDSESSDNDEGSGDPSGDLASTDEADSSPGGDDELGEADGGADTPGSDALPDHGSPEDVVDLVQDFSGHNHDEDEEVTATLGPKSDVDNAAIDKAIIQNAHFDNPTATVYDIRVFTWPKDDRRCEGWEPYYENENLTLRIGDKDHRGNDAWDQLRTSEEILQPTLFEMRRVFSDNRRSRYDRNQKRGKLDARALGRRAWKATEDPRLFKKMERPGKRSYAVVMAGDASSSAANGAIVVEKQAMLAQAELCHRMGVDFEVWFHTADEYEGPLLPPDFNKSRDDAWTQDMYQVKGWNTPWNDQAREGLAWMHPVYTNLDGHNLEFLRKRLMVSQATTKILLYYTDGQMPAANRLDEIETLKREVDNYQRAGIIMLGVGVGTSSPIKWGMDTVRIDNKGDVGKVIKHLERRLIMA